MIKELIKYKNLLVIFAIGFVAYDLTGLINNFTFINVLNKLSIIVFFASVILYINGKNMFGLIMMYASNLFLIYPLISDSDRIAYYFRSIGITLVCCIFFTFIYRSDRKKSVKESNKRPGSIV